MRVVRWGGGRMPNTNFRGRKSASDGDSAMEENRNRKKKQ